MTALLLLLALLAAPEGESPLRAALVEGSATVNGAALAQGRALQTGDTVQTAAGARVEISSSSGAVLRLAESSRMTLGAVQPGKAFSARLFLGNLWAKVHKLAAGESYQLETENAVAGVRGTEFRVEVAPGRDDLVRVYEGAVEVRAHDGRWTHRLEPGHELRFARERAAPQSFDPESEKDHKLMRWVRERREEKERAEHPHKQERRERRKAK